VGRADVVVTSRTVPFRGGTVVVREAGDGPLVGYLHGMIGAPPEHPFLDAVAAEGFRVVAPCLPGFSGSDPCEDLRGIFDWVVATSEVVDLAGLAGAPVVASSVGAMLAFEVAAVRPEAFAAIVAVGPFGLFDLDDPVTDPYATTLSSQRGLLTADVATTASFFEDDTSMLADVLIEHGVDRYLTRTSAASLIWPIPDHGLDTRIHRVSAPVTLVWGADDEVVPPSYADRFAAVLPDVRGRHLVEGAGHLAELDRPAEVAALVTAALR
jgi:pimeloyl-ACP methyl ester carboxylesterase